METYFPLLFFISFLSFFRNLCILQQFIGVENIHSYCAINGFLSVFFFSVPIYGFFLLPILFAVFDSFSLSLSFFYDRELLLFFCPNLWPFLLPILFVIFLSLFLTLSLSHSLSHARSLSLSLSLYYDIYFLCTLHFFFLLFFFFIAGVYNFSSFSFSFFSYHFFYYKFTVSFLDIPLSHSVFVSLFVIYITFLSFLSLFIYISYYFFF
ncbi:unnamed protein product [Acanthosepion pharaonis]|uniref:Uncharacterized protein n=1 Tax=Acanthosepion pharaonis TaxID=158019 RepID=A0A812DID3_ACAPH|nr:unnamed protein product [Sepia pharaonis]